MVTKEHAIRQLVSNSDTLFKHCWYETFYTISIEFFTHLNPKIQGKIITKVSSKSSWFYSHRHQTLHRNIKIAMRHTTVRAQTTNATLQCCILTTPLGALSHTSSFRYLSIQKQNAPSLHHNISVIKKNFLYFLIHVTNLYALDKVLVSLIQLVLYF